MILVDTNIPLRIVQPDHKHHVAALDAVRLLRNREGDRPAIAPQSLYEMYVVLTRPTSGNGFGYSPIQASAELAAARALFRPLNESDKTYATWKDLVVKYSVSGNRAHDVRLVATMLLNNVDAILTFDDAHFRRFSEIQTLNPFDILGLSRV